MVTYQTYTVDTDQRVDRYWNAVFLLTSVEGNGHYQLLPCLVKSCLVFAHANVDSERSLSVNARVVMKERSRFGEQTIVGLRLLKDAVKFHDPVNWRPEKIPVTKEMRKSVRLAYSAYKARLDQEKEEKKKELEAETMRKKEEEEKLKKEIEEKLNKEKEKLLKPRERGGCFKGREESKRRFRSCRWVTKWHNLQTPWCSFSVTVNRQSVSVATMMLDTARNKREQAMQQLKAVGEKRKPLDTKTHKLLQKTIPSAQLPAKSLRNRVKSCHFCDRWCYNCIVEFVTCFLRTMFCWCTCIDWYAM